MTLRAGMFGMGLLAALAARAGEQGAPLEKSKQELKTLQKEQGAPGGEASLGKLRDAMPQIQPSLLGNTPADPARNKNSESELRKKKDAQKNWLLDGMDKLDKNQKSKGTEAKDNLIETKTDHEQSGDQSNSESLLQLYSEQQKKDETKAAKQSPARHADPLAPFLQGWLSDSPVRGKFFDEYVRKPEAAPTGGGSPAPALTESNAGPVSPGFEAGGAGSRNGPGAAPPSPNPYLQGFDLAALPDAGSGSRPATASPTFQAGGPAAPAAPPIDPVPAARSPDKKASPAAWSDDKKYFPQMKKF